MTSTGNVSEKPIMPKVPFPKSTTAQGLESVRSNEMKNLTASEKDAYTKGYETAKYETFRLQDEAEKELKQIRKGVYAESGKDEYGRITNLPKFLSSAFSTLFQEMSAGIRSLFGGKK